MGTQDGPNTPCFARVASRPSWENRFCGNRPTYYDAKRGVWWCWGHVPKSVRLEAERQVNRRFEPRP